MLVLLKWICAHLLGDFVFQSRKMVLHKRQHKGRSGYLYLHACIQALLIYLVTGWWTNWEVPLVVLVTHFLIDWWKLYRPDTLLYFILDQCLHLAVLAALGWWFLAPDRPVLLSDFKNLWQSTECWLVLLSYLFVVWPCALILSYTTRKWRNAAEQNLTPRLNLDETGRWIGILERALVLTFILVNHFEGIGFLVAAKSVLRFGDLKGANNRAETEYVLIGTLASFSISILTGLLCVHLLHV